MNPDQIAAVVIIAAALLILAAGIVNHLSEEAAAADWERHVNTIPLSPEMEKRLAEAFPPWPTDTPIYAELKRKQDVQFVAEAIEELRAMGVDLVEGDVG